MNLAVLGHGICPAEDLSTLKMAPAWRKATRNMILSAAALDRARPEGVDFKDAVVGLILHSSSGELDTSADFLITLDQQKMARPVLFQNSLHNATTGFLSIAYALTGPSVTLSAGSEEAVELADALLQSGACDFCWVVSCEVHKRLALMAEQDLREGAAAVLLAREDAAVSRGVPVKARITEFEIARTPLSKEKLREQPLLSFDRDFLAQWVETLGNSKSFEVTANHHRVNLAWT